LNEGSDGADVTSGDSPFQTRAATTGKARSPTVVRRVGGTMSVDVEADRSRSQHSFIYIYVPFVFRQISTVWSSVLTISMVRFDILMLDWQKCTD